MPNQPNPPDHPLDLNEVDRAIRRNELIEQARDMGIEPEVSDDCPPGAHADFLQSIIDYETAPIGTRFEQLENAGVELASPDSLDDAALTAKLWEVARKLAEFDVYLYRTDHLSDRELYEHLWDDSLREIGPIIPQGSGWRNHIDILGGCSEEDIQTGLRFYESEAERQRWAQEWPDDPMPPHEDPPFDRDRFLPKADPPF